MLKVLDRSIEFGVVAVKLKFESTFCGLLGGRGRNELAEEFLGFKMIKVLSFQSSGTCTAFLIKVQKFMFALLHLLDSNLCI